MIKYVNFVCEHCGKTFQKTERYVRMQTNKDLPIKFCSRECKDKHRRNWITIPCAYCGKEVTKNKNDIVNKTFCNKECYDAYRLSHKTKLTCKNCHKEFLEDNSYIESQQNRNQNRLFCSKKCFNEYLKKDMIEIECEICGKKFLRNKSKVEKNEHNFCSSKCLKAFRKIEYNTYKKTANYLRSHSLYEEWRNNVLKKADFHCEECGSNSNLHAHHIEHLFLICRKYNFDIDKILESKEFNDIQNGKCLCKKCHTKLHVFMKEKMPS